MTEEAKAQDLPETLDIQASQERDFVSAQTEDSQPPVASQSDATPPLTQVSTVEASSRKRKPSESDDESNKKIKIAESIDADIAACMTSNIRLIERCERLTKVVYDLVSESHDSTALKATYDEDMAELDEARRLCIRHLDIVPQ